MQIVITFYVYCLISNISKNTTFAVYLVNIFVYKCQMNWLFFSPFLFPLKIRRKKKRNNSKTSFQQIFVDMKIISSYLISTLVTISKVLFNYTSLPLRRSLLLFSLLMSSFPSSTNSPLVSSASRNCWKPRVDNNLEPGKIISLNT